MRVLAVLTTTIALHAYLGVRLIRPWLLDAPWAQIAWGLLFTAPLYQFAVMTLRFRRRDVPTPFKFLLYFLMGAFWIALSTTLLRDIVWWCLRLAKILPGDTVERHALFLQTNLGVYAAVVLALCWGFVEARRTPRLRAVDAKLKRLPAAFSGFKIAHITDLHISDTIGPRFVAGVVTRVNESDADIVVLTGDIVDTDVDAGRQAAAELAGFSKPAYYVTGNHEYYNDVESWLPVLEETGLRILMNEHEVLERDGAHLVIAGVPDRAGGAVLEGHAPNFAQAKSGAPEDAASVVLSHQPRTAPEAAKAGFDLMMAGHTHGGQMWPFHYLVRLQQPIVEGLARVGDMVLWTSRGTGYWGPPVRYLAPSEVSLVRLVVDEGEIEDE